MIVKVYLYDDNEGHILVSFRVKVPNETFGILDLLPLSEAEAEICSCVRRYRPQIDLEYPNANWVVVWPEGSRQNKSMLAAI